jgi:eukaryotic-like serine/threonine-protein kinase
MDKPHWENLKAIFEAAIALAPAERAAYLDRVCDGNGLLRQTVDSLIRSHEESGNFVDKPAFQAAAEMFLDRINFTSGQQVAHYKVISKIGEGGMGQVYLAEDTKLNRRVSLKFLSSSLTGDRERLRRFEQEARAASALNHPNILTIHEISEADGHRFIATEFIEGKTLRERLHSGVDIDDAIDIAIQVASALVAAHRVNIVHRDIKPENIMIRTEDGLVKVLDFGLAKIATRKPSDASADSKVATAMMANTAPGVVIGTVAYMSPEQARGETIDEGTDIWSLGVVLYEMIAGCSPFMAGTSNEIVSGILSKAPAPPLTRFAHDIPPRLEEIVEKALTKKRDERYQTSKDLLIDLKRLKLSWETKALRERDTALDRSAAGGVTFDSPGGNSAPATGPVHTQATSNAEYVFNQVKSHKRVALVTLAVLLVVVSSVLIYAWRGRRAAGPATTAIGSIAVLPLVNVNADPEMEYLSDGITDNLIERLSQLPNLRVMSHTAVFHYKGRETDIPAIGRELGVEAVLTGRLSKRNDTFTISLELVNASDNSHIWGEQYHRQLSDLLIVQREIPVDVSDKLRLRLSGESRERLARSYTTSSEAYQLYLKGRHSWEKWTEQGARQAVQFFEEAIKKDPNYALAYAGLADAYLFGTGVGPELPQKDAHRLARDAATKALSLDPLLGETHGALAQVILYDDWDFAGAERELKRALELKPSYAEGHHQYSHLLLLLGRNDESLIESKKFLELDPVSEPPIGHLGYHFLYSRQYDEAIRQFQKDIQLYPDSPQYVKLGNAFFEKGRFSEAVDAFLIGFAKEGLGKDEISKLKQAFAQSGSKGFLRKLLEILKGYPQTGAITVNVAGLYARLGEKDLAFEWLEKAYGERADEILRLKEELDFDNLRSDPRYADLLRRIGLPE